MAIARNLPAAVGADGTASLTPSRAGIYGEAYVNPISGKELFAADEASYFMALNSTPGTGIIGTASTAAQARGRCSRRPARTQVLRTRRGLWSMPARSSLRRRAPRF